jgi:ribosomal-protein-alanine N-acetyltransferase
LQLWDATVPPGGTERPASFRGLVARLQSNGRQGLGMPFAIDVEGRFAGQVTVNNIVRGSAQFASIGYWLDRDVAGRGIMPTAVALVVDHCFRSAGLHRIEVAIRPENSNSLRVVEKLGIREVGYAPRYLHIDGAWRDHRIYAVTVEECPGGMLARLSQPSQQ